MRERVQVAESDLIGALAGALAAVQRTAGRADHVSWNATAMMSLDICVGVHRLLNAARWLPDVDASAVDAGWQRSGKLRLPQNMAKVCPGTHSLHPAAARSNKPCGRLLQQHGHDWVRER